MTSAPPRVKPRPAHVLVADDEPALRRSLARALMTRGLTVDTAESGAAALDLMRTRPIDALLLDGGLDVLGEIRRLHPEVEVVLMTALGDHATAAAALQAGAYAVLTTPLPSPEAAVPAVERAAERRRLVERARALEQKLADHEQLGEVVGSSLQMTELLRRAAAAASSSAPILILGERGTGRGSIARHVHRRSNRALAPLVVLSPAELREEAAEAELAGALEQADGATLLLLDVGALPRGAQAVLARALAGPKATSDVRIIATAQPGLREQVARGEIREELFYRLAAVLLEVPPLRRRREDIPLLAYHFLSRYAAREGKVIRRITAEALRTLRRHAWPGNVGELRGVLEHAAVMAQRDAILPADLPIGQDEEHDDEGTAFAGAEVLELPYTEAKLQAVAAFDRVYVERRMKRTGGNVTEAARMAGMDRSNFRRLVKKVRGQGEDDSSIEDA